MITPKSMLLPYERAWVDDHSRFKLGLWARQTGKSFSTAEEAVEDCFLRKTTWVTMSAGERQALEWMRKAKQWVEAYQVAITSYDEMREEPEALMRSAEITFANGSRIISIPANPDTARGYTANVVLDEFAFHERPEAVWRAIFPSISRARMRLRLVSTANGKGNKFYELYTKANRYSKHRITIHDAIAQGLEVDLEELREGIGDSEAWAQEYECEFIDTASVLLPYDLIATCEHQEATIGWEWNGHPPANPMFIGIDFARKKDNTVAWVFEQIGDVLWTREVIVLKGMSTPAQVEALAKRIRYATRVSVDYTGPGVGFGDYLVQEHGEYKPQGHQFGKVELCTFTNSVVRDIMPKMRMAFEGGKVRIPINREVREDLHAIHRTATPSGQLTYKAPYTATGHSDRGYACALALHAAQTNETVYHAALI